MNKTFTVINEAETHTELKDDSYEKNKTMTNESSIDKIMTPVQIQNIHHDNTVNV